MPKGIHNWRFVDVKRFLSDYNFNISHIKGSHYFYIGSVKGTMHQVCVPFHGNKAIHPKTMKSIINQSGIALKIWIGK
ncbi:MAG: hypothetical protein QG583_807 [Patescibacteria group bacterium]|nr:hypothetical protein [Patescibacteria group bacterium]MDQ5971372.1 hypothetical protein [Patescibacteria group bacterium]